LPTESWSTEGKEMAVLKEIKRMSKRAGKLELICGWGFYACVCV